MAAGSVYQVVRKRIAPVAILLAFGLLVFQTCGKKERIDATIVLDLGPPSVSEQVSEVEVDVLVGTDPEPFARFRRNRDAAGVMGTPTFAAVLPEPHATLAIRLHAPGRIVDTRRDIVADDGATITVPLADLLATP